MKRILALLLSIVMVFSLVPTSAFATQTQPVTEATEEIVEETTAPTEEVVEETTEPTEEVVAEPIEPTEEVVEETTEPTEEVLEETTEPTEEVVEETTEPTEEVLEETTEPTEEVLEETTEPTEEVVEEDIAEEAAADALSSVSLEISLPEEFQEAGQIDIWGTESITLIAAMDSWDSEVDPADLEVLWTLNEGDEDFASLVVQGWTPTSNGWAATVTAVDVSELRTVTVSVSCNGEDMDSMEVTIHPRARQISIFVNEEDVTDQRVPFDLNVLVGEEPNYYYQTFQEISAKVAPADELAGVTWSSSDKTIARMTTSKITGEPIVQFTGKTGDVDIIATATDGSGTFGVVTFNAVSLPQDIYVIEGKTELVSGGTTTLKVHDELDQEVPASAVEWELADVAFASYVSVTAAGKVTAKTVLEAVTVVLQATVTYSTTPVQILHEITIYPAVTKLEIAHKGDPVHGTTLYWDVDDGALTFIAVQNPDVVYGIPDWSISGNKDAITYYVDEETNELTVYIPNDPNDYQPVDISKKFGTFTIKAAATDGSGKSATVSVKLSRYVKDIAITSSLGSNPILYGGESMQLTATVSAKNIEEKPVNSAVVWSLKNASDKNYVTLSSSGKVTAKKGLVVEREITVVATAKDGYGTTEEFTFTVQPADLGVPVILKDDENVTNTTVSVNLLDDPSVDLTAALFSGDSPYLMTWKSSSKNAVIDDHEDNTATVTISKAGTYTITASDVFGNKAKVTLKASKLSESVEITSKTEAFSVSSGKTLQLVGTVLPKGSVSNKAVSWWIDPADTAYATITSGGKITAAKGLTFPREITVWAQAKDGNSDPVSESVLILPLATGLQIIGTDFEVTNTTYTWDMAGENNSLTLEARVFPEASHQEVTWKSSNNKIAKVDAATGEVTILKTGTVTITATATDGSGKKATFKLKVIKSVEELELDRSVAALASGKTLTLKAIVDAYATDKSVKWTVSGENKEFVTIYQNGKVKAHTVTEVKENIVITATAQDGSERSASCTITLYPDAIKKVQILYNDAASPKNLGLDLDDSLTLSAVSSPEAAAQGYGAYTWKASSSKIVTIEDNEDGSITVYGLKKGTVTITCYAADGSGKTASVKIKVS